MKIAPIAIALFIVIFACLNNFNNIRIVDEQIAESKRYIDDMKLKLDQINYVEEDINRLKVEIERIAKETDKARERLGDSADKFLGESLRGN